MKLPLTCPQFSVVTKVTHRSKEFLYVGVVLGKEVPKTWGISFILLLEVKHCLKLKKKIRKVICKKFMEFSNLLIQI